MENRKFDISKYKKLNNPKRLLWLPPELITERVNLDEVSTVLDIGAGIGFFSREFAKCYPNATVYAADISPVMVDYIKDNVSPEVPAVQAMLMSDYAVPLRDSCADLIIMINLHHEIDDPRAMLKESYRLLRPRGRIMISDWKKENTEKGPSLESRYDIPGVKSQLHAEGFIDLRSYNDLKLNFIVIGTRP